MQYYALDVVRLLQLLWIDVTSPSSIGRKAISRGVPRRTRPLAEGGRASTVLLSRLPTLKHAAWPCVKHFGRSSETTAEDTFRPDCSTRHRLVDKNTGSYRCGSRACCRRWSFHRFCVPKVIERRPIHGYQWGGGGGGGAGGAGGGGGGGGAGAAF